MINAIPDETFLPGDIIFVARKDFIGALIKARQAGLRTLKGEFIPTHVAISISDFGLIIESTPQNGVDVSGIHKYIENGDYDGRILVIRNLEFEKRLKESPGLIEQYRDSFSSSWRLKYNSIGAVFKMGFDGMRFCSELAAECLISAGILSKETVPAGMYPIDLLRMHAETDGWREVDIAAMLTLSKARTNSFFDGLLLSLKRNSDIIGERIDQLTRHAGLGVELGFDIRTILENLNAMDDSVRKSSLEMEDFRKRKLKDIELARKKFDEAVEYERYWRVLKEAERASGR